MRKFSYRGSMKNKKSLKYGGYATVTTIVLLKALVLINVLFNLLGWEVDLTVEKLYTPSDVTMEILDDFFGKLREALVPVIQKVSEKKNMISQEVQYSKVYQTMANM